MEFEDKDKENELNFNEMGYSNEQINSYILYLLGSKEEPTDISLYDLGYSHSQIYNFILSKQKELKEKREYQKKLKAKKAFGPSLAAEKYFK